MPEADRYELRDRLANAVVFSREATRAVEDALEKWDDANPATSPRANAVEEDDARRG